MTDHTTTPDPGGNRLDAWLEHNLTDLDTTLADGLDIDAGLRDAQLPHRAHTLDTMLHTAVDVDAGLQAITRAHGTQPQPESTTPTTPDPPRDAVLAIFHPFGVSSAFNILSLNTRLRLRSRLIASGGLDKIPEHACRQIVFSRMSEQAAALQELVNHRSASNRPGQFSQLNRRQILHYLHMTATEFLDKITSFLDNVSWLTNTFRMIATNHEELVEVEALLEHLQLTLKEAQTLTASTGPGISGGLSKLRNTVATIVHDFVADLVQILARIDYGATSSSYELGRLIDSITLWPHHGEEGLVLRSYARLLTNAIARADHGEVRSICDALDHLLSDFTSTDLSEVELDGIDLRGVRWSLTTTRWPDGWQEPILEASVPINPGPHPDLYEVRNDPRIRHVAHHQS
jgi:hypothetical protein